MKLYGKNWTRRQLESRVGRLDQIGGARRLRAVEGPESGTEIIQVRTGAGLAYDVLPSRGMDIGLAEYGSIPLSWQASPGAPHPAYYDPRGLEWLRTAAGGLLMTCGLTQVGAPCRDGNQELGLHGRVHHIPARCVCAEGHWIGNEYEMRVAGVVEETAIFGEYLRLTREIRSRLGENRISIRDTVENLGFTPVPHMILYHFNFGFPLMTEHTRIILPSRKVVPREQETPVRDYDKWQKATAGYAERVYYHEQFREKAGRAEAIVRNPRFPTAGGQRCSVEVRLTWSAAQLPVLVQWKMPGEGAHVLGLEPANCRVGGRAAERDRGSLVHLQPGESRAYELEFDVRRTGVRD